MSTPCSREESALFVFIDYMNEYHLEARVLTLVTLSIAMHQHFKFKRIVFGMGRMCRVPWTSCCSLWSLSLTP
ncbi:rCG46482 [Rattus norvegicus]|uniref:RCG46482 n=1 Tax=Rattus norvegicus TaxID=10116 RepID=A6ICJ4_RAT|nr:rCG46482 [Rattus norvegicus]